MMERLVSAMGLSCLIMHVAGSSAAQKPHVVLILADDYGWASLGVHRRGQTGGSAEQGILETHTPNMDQLIDEGILLDRHYAFKICSPSRSSLQSGRLAVHVNMENTGVTVENPNDPVSGYAGIPRNMTGIAQKLKSAGYRTHMVGKWDAGMATPEHTPLGKGYESWVGYFQHANDYWRKGMDLQSTGEVDNCADKFIDLFKHNDTYRGGVRDGISVSPECLADPESNPACYEEELFKTRALEIVNGHDVSTPLFLFYAFHLLHTPLQVPDTYLTQIDQIVTSKGAAGFDTQNRRLYAAMTLYMDEAIGEVVKALKAKRMWENTLIIFTADNGGPIYEPGSANNYPLKGGKYTDWEGGVRTNAFLSGGFVPENKRGTKFSGVVSIADWFGTLCNITGVDMTDFSALAANDVLKTKGLPLLPPVESIAQWDFILSGHNGRPGPLHLSTQALLWWPFKLVTGKQVYSAWTGPLYPNCTTVNNTHYDQGPMFQDFKIFNIPLTLGGDEATQDRITWTHDCGDGCLFNVDADPTEHSDLAQHNSHGDTLARLQKQLNDFNQPEHIFSPTRGEPQVAACESFVDNGGFYGPFVDIDDYYSPLPPLSLKQKLQHKADKAKLRLINKEFVQKGVAWIAQQVVPKVRAKSIAGRFDKCFNTTKPMSGDATLLV